MVQGFRAKLWIRNGSICVEEGRIRVGVRKKNADTHHGLLDREKELLVINDVPDHWPEQPPPPARTRVDSRTFQKMYFHQIRYRYRTFQLPYFSSKDIRSGSLELELSKEHKSKSTNT
jgi:hypothetical protein